MVRSLLGDDGEPPSLKALTAGAWIIAAGTYGYIAGIGYEGADPVAGYTLILGMAIGVGMSGAIALSVRDRDD